MDVSGAQEHCGIILPHIRDRRDLQAQVHFSTFWPCTLPITPNRASLSTFDDIELEKDPEPSWRIAPTPPNLGIHQACDLDSIENPSEDVVRAQSLNWRIHEYLGGWRVNVWICAVILAVPIDNGFLRLHALFGEVFAQRKSRRRGALWRMGI